MYSSLGSPAMECMGFLLQIFLTDIMIFVAGLSRVCCAACLSILCYEEGYGK